MKNSIRDNTKDLIVNALDPKEIEGDKSRWYEIAAGVCDRLGLDNAHADIFGSPPPIAIITVVGGVAQVTHNAVPVVIIDWDGDGDEPTVEVIA